MRRQEPGAERAEGRLDELAAIHGLDARARSALAGVLQLLARDEHAPTTVRAPGLAVDRHLADSLVALELTAVRHAKRLVDIGSGAGFPGIPLAIALPAAHVSLIESSQRKCLYLKRACVALELTNTDVVCSPAEGWRAGICSADVAVARALAPQAVVLELAAPLLQIHGVLVDWRSTVPDADRSAAASAVADLGLREVERRTVHPYIDASDLTLYVFEKVRDTPELFPRRPGLARRKPLGY